MELLDLALRQGRTRILRRKRFRVDRDLADGGVVRGLGLLELRHDLLALGGREVAAFGALVEKRPELLAVVDFAVHHLAGEFDAEREIHRPAHLLRQVELRGVEGREHGLEMGAGGRFPRLVLKPRLDHLVRLVGAGIDQSHARHKAPRADALLVVAVAEMQRSGIGRPDISKRRLLVAVQDAHHEVLAEALRLPHHRYLEVAPCLLAIVDDDPLVHSGDGDEARSVRLALDRRLGLQQLHFAGRMVDMRRRHNLGAKIAGTEVIVRLAEYDPHVLLAELRLERLVDVLDAVDDLRLVAFVALVVGEAPDFVDAEREKPLQKARRSVGLAGLVRRAAGVERVRRAHALLAARQDVPLDVGHLDLAPFDL